MPLSERWALVLANLLYHSRIHAPRHHLGISVIPLVAVLALVAAGSDAQLYYPSLGSMQRVDAAQLWYNGYWKHPGWINGTLVKSSCTDCAGKIHLLGNIIAPYESAVRKAIRNGASAVVIARDRPGTPGQGMYYVELGDQSDLNVPVVEVYQLSKNNPHSILTAVGSGISISLWPQENQWKKAHDKVAFQITLNVVLTATELAILLIGAYRLNQWTTPSCSRLQSIGPVCILLEMVSAVLRLLETAVDPFFSMRIYPGTFALVLLTSSMPFILSSGILLTFFWAETLKASRIQASPFIAEYKKSAAFVIFILFAGEISTSTIRAIVPVTGRFNTAYISQVFYVVTSIVLIICYLLCAHEITKRLATGSSKRKNYIRNMNIRFALSTSGYMMFILATIASIPLVSRSPWGWKIIFNLLYLSLNIAGILQVYSLKPVGNHSKTTSRKSVSHTEATTNTGGSASSPRNIEDSLV